MKEKDDEVLAFDRHGHVLTDNQQKAKNLLTCVEHGGIEDALGHALDLVERLRRQCRRRCKEVYGDQRMWPRFTVSQLRQDHHVEECYEDYLKWLRETDRQEIEQK